LIGDQAHDGLSGTRDGDLFTGRRTVDQTG
jgi:hypothetical protein